MANTREIRDAAEKAENKAKEAAAKKEFEKAADYFTFAADAYRRIGKNINDDDKQARCEARAQKLEQLSQQCRQAIKRGEAKPEPPRELQQDNMEERGELEMAKEAPPPPEEDETVEVDIPGESDQEPESDSELSLTDVAEKAEESEEDSSVVAPPPPVKPGVKIPKTKKLKRGNLPGKAPIKPKKKGSSRVVAPPAKKPAPAVAAPPKAQAPEDDVAEELPDETEVAPPPPVEQEPDLEGEPVLGPKDSARRSSVASDGDLDELADHASNRHASVVISLDNEDFPEQEFTPDEFSIELSPRFTEHLCKALTVGDLSQIAVKFNKLADNLLRKAMGGDPRDELDLRFTALACREVADRLLATPPGDPAYEIDQARRAYRRGDRKVAAELYKKAALAVLGDEDDSDEKTSLHERQASEYLSFSSRLRKVREDA